MKEYFLINILCLNLEFPPQVFWTDEFSLRALIKLNF